VVQPFIAVDGSHSATLLDHCLLVDRQIDQDFEIVDKCKIRASVLGVEKDLFSAINNCLELQSFRGFVTRKLHLMLHGRAGALRFAGQWFDLAALIACKSEIKSWGLDEIVLWSHEVLHLFVYNISNFASFGRLPINILLLLNLQLL